MRRRTGGPPSPSSRSCWGSRTCSTTPTSRTPPRPRPTPAFVRTGPTTRRGWGPRPGPWLPSRAMNHRGQGWPTLRIMELLQICCHPLIILCIFVFEPNVYIYFISWYKTTVLSKFVTSITVSINDVYDTLCYLIIHDWVSKFRSAASRNLLQQTLELSFGLDHWPMPPVLCWCCKM